MCASSSPESLTDFHRLCAIVKKNLAKKPCHKAENGGKTGCIGICDDCLKQKKYIKIVQRNQDDAILRAAATEAIQKIEELPPHLLHRLIGKLPIETRIKNWQEFFLADGPPGTVGRDRVEDPINERGEYGRTEIMEAMLAGDVERVEDLLAEGADPEIADNTGMNCIDIALMEGLTVFIQLFRDAGYIKDDAPPEDDEN